MDKLNYVIKYLHIVYDSEYGAHVYFKHSYLNIEFSYYTHYDKIVDILHELSCKIIDFEKNKN